MKNEHGCLCHLLTQWVTGLFLAIFSHRLSSPSMTTTWSWIAKSLNSGNGSIQTSFQCLLLAVSLSKPSNGCHQVTTTMEYLAMPLLAFFSKWPACHQMRIFGWTGSLPWLQPFVPTWCAGGKCQLFLANVSLADIETVIEHPFGMPHQINLGFGSKAGGKMCSTLS